MSDINCPVCHTICRPNHNKLGYFCANCLHDSPTNCFSVDLNPDEMNYMLKTNDILLTLQYSNNVFVLSVLAPDNKRLYQKFATSSVKAINFNSNTLRQQIDERLNKMFKLLKMKNFK